METLGGTAERGDILLGPPEADRPPQWLSTRAVTAEMPGPSGIDSCTEKDDSSLLVNKRERWRSKELMALSKSIWIWDNTAFEARTASIGGGAEVAMGSPVVFGLIEVRIVL
jgi:hypothetical protein